jgi:beta-ureidopropionase
MQDALVRSVRVGLVKAMPVMFDLDGNWRLFESLVRGVGQSGGVQLFCSSEAFLDGYIVKEPCDSGMLLGVAQDIQRSRYIQQVQLLARQVNAHIVFGFTQRIGDEGFNAAVLVDPCGAVVGTYHKIQLQSHELVYAPGRGLPVFETSLGTLGIMICADRRWPETGRALRLAGAELLLTPSYGMWDDTNECLMRTRSFENDVDVCFVHPNVAFVTDSQGGVPAKLLSNVPGVLVHDVRLHAPAGSRHLNERRPDLYATLTR